MRKMRVTPVLMILLISSLLLSSCSRQETSDRKADRHGYSFSICELPGDPEHETVLCDVLRSDDRNYAVTYNFAVSDSVQDCVTVYAISDEGQIVDRLTIDSSDYPYSGMSCGIIDGKLALVSVNNTIDLYTLSDGEAADSIDPGRDLIISGIEETEDGYVILSSGSVVRYYSDGRDAVEVTDRSLSAYGARHPFFETGDRSYVLCYGDNGLQYCEIDFEKREVTRIADPYAITTGIRYLDRDYVLDSGGIKRIDILGSTFNVITKWDDLDIRPETRTLYGSDYYVSDDDHFVKTYQYPDGTIELLLFSYDSSIDHSDRKIITVGGYGISNDLAMEWAIYLFNTSQEEYRIRCDEYNDRFGWATSEEAYSARAALIQYFEAGNAPDIYYGNGFDLGYLGRVGLLSDLSKIMSEDIIGSCSFAGYEEGTPLYTVYAGYTSSGFWGCSDNIGYEGELSYDELETMSEEKGIIPFYPLRSADIVDMIIRYDIDDRIAISEQIPYSSDELENIIGFAVTHGVPYDAQISFGSFSDLKNDSAILIMGSLSDIYSFDSFAKVVDRDVTYAGYPASDGSVHLVYPCGMVGISSATDIISGCSLFIESLLDQQTQKVLAVNGVIPIDSSVLQEVVTAACYPESVASDDPVLISFVLGHDPVDPDIAGEYLAAVGTMDKVISYDWGIYNMIVDEVNSYDIAGKTPSEIADSLSSRLGVYSSENY